MVSGSGSLVDAFLYIDGGLVEIVDWKTPCLRLVVCWSEISLYVEVSENKDVRAKGGECEGR